MKPVKKRSGPIFASPTETQGLVLIEAMALGVPVVSTAVMGTASVLRHAQGARVAPPSVREFADAVVVLLRDRAERDRLSRLARIDAQAWSVASLMAKLEHLYRHLPAPRVEPDAGVARL